MVDANGNNPKNNYYTSFGDYRLSTAASLTDKGFTGQTRDASTGLYFYGARYYDSSLGRFISPDPNSQVSIAKPETFLPLTVSYSKSGTLNQLNGLNRGENSSRAGSSVPIDPQLLNRYSYSRNNPLTYSDPTGNYVHIAVGALVGFYAGYGAYHVSHFGSDDFSEAEAGKWALAGAAGGAATAALGGAVLYVAQSAAAIPAGTTALGAAQQLTSGRLNPAQVGNLVKAIVSESTQLGTKGITVIGHMYSKTGSYVDKAKQVGGTYFQMSKEVAAQLSDDLQWAANKQFLDNAIARGDQFLLGTKLERASSFFARELAYLESQGYTKVVIDGLEYMQKVE